MRRYRICTSRRLLYRILERFLEDWSRGLVVRDNFLDVFYVGLSKQRRKEGEERNRCSEEALYIMPLISSSLDVHYFQGRIMGKRKEKSSSEFTSLTFFDETTPHVATEEVDHVLLPKYLCSCLGNDWFT
jgi:hypothetical protein